MNSTIEHPLFGAVTLCRPERSRRISIAVKPTGEIRLSFPRGVSQKEALAFLDSKAEWIAKAKAKIAAKVPPKKEITMPFATRSHSLSLNPASTLRVSAKVGDGQIVVTYPADKNCSDEDVQQMIRWGIEKAWEIEAKALLPGRLAELSKRAGLSYHSVAVRNTKSRWGSCSSRNDISLSLHLMRLPDELVDYILLHELCHIAHKNHSADFYRLLDRLTGGRHAALQREMKKYNTLWN